MKSDLFKPAVVGGLLALADGLALVICFHTALDFLAGYLIYPAYPCYFVAYSFGSPFPSPEWFRWAVGVAAMTFVGAVLGLAVRGIQSLIWCH